MHAMDGDRKAESGTINDSTFRGGGFSSIRDGVVIVRVLRPKTWKLHSHML